ncbi:MAG TPA: FHA domain-containing protein [Thermomicrobiales bacterium]|nr:FHA domain-containing protein [Thermomicrobiales bacterium]
MPEFESAFLTFEWVMLLLRIAFIGLIYVFLYQIARVALREMVAIGYAVGQQERRSGARRMTAALVVIEPAESSLGMDERIPLSTYTTIGRAAGNALVIDDSFTSSNHAEIVREDDRWLVRDLGSTNGTWVNGRRIHGQTWIEPGDDIAFGNVVVTFTG